MTHTNSTFLPIPHTAEPDWHALFRQLICEKNEPLVKIKTNDRIQIYAAYHDMNLPGALPDIWVRRTVFERLSEALNYLPEHLGLLILDGWRSLSVQVALRQNMEAQIAREHPQWSADTITAFADHFVAKPQSSPDSPSPHLTGGSVDITLFDCISGKTLDMGSAFDSPHNESHTAFFENESADPIFRNRRRILYHAMRKAGFTNLPSEWWHYDFGNQSWAYFAKQPSAFFGATQPQE